jgi:hypothetical protein
MDPPRNLVFELELMAESLNAKKKKNRNWVFFFFFLKFNFVKSERKKFKMTEF